MDSDITKMSIENRNLSHYHGELDKIFKLYNLTSYLKNFLDTNLNCVGFHSNQNTISLVLNCYEGAVIHELTSNQIKVLLLGALFSNFKCKSRINQSVPSVKQALLGLNKVHILLAKNVKLKDEHILDTEVLIKSTKNLSSKKPPICIKQKILYDAFKMVVYENSELRLQTYLDDFVYRPNPSYTGVKTYLYQCGIELGKVNWVSHWGYVKAIKRNYPDECKKLIKDLTVTLNEHS